MNTVDVLLTLIKNELNDNYSNVSLGEVNWEDLYRLACEQNVVAILHDAIEKIDIKLDSSIWKRWQDDTHSCIMIDAIQMYELEWLADACKENGIMIMPVKGCILKSLYPKSYYRSMGDIDFLYDTKCDEKLKKILIERGYSCKEFNTFYHDLYEMPPYLYLEPHRTLVSPDNASWYKFYKNGFGLGSADEDNPYYYKIDKIMCFLFYLTHFYKHFSRMGAGVRFVMDFYVIKNSWSDDISYEVLEPYLKQLNIIDFYHQVDALACYWFGDSKSSVPLDIQEYILGSGVFGNTDQGFNNRVKQQGKLRYFLSLVFPPLYYMKWKYLVLNKVPALLPFCWLHRTFTYPFKRKDFFKYRMRQFFGK